MSKQKQPKLTLEKKEELKQLKKHLRELESQLQRATKQYNVAIEKLDKAEEVKLQAEDAYWTALAARDDAGDALADWLDQHESIVESTPNTTED